jgi:hypothetical protein
LALSLKECTAPEGIDAKARDAHCSELQGNELPGRSLQCGGSFDVRPDAAASTLPEDAVDATGRSGS